jgi:hypothetical protein
MVGTYFLWGFLQAGFAQLVSKPARRALQGMLCAGFSREHSIRNEDGEAERQKQGIVVIQVDPADDKENGDYMKPWDHLVAVRRPIIIQRPPAAMATNTFCSYVSHSSRIISNALLYSIC